MIRRQAVLSTFAYLLNLIDYTYWKLFKKVVGVKNYYFILYCFIFGNMLTLLMIDYNQGRGATLPKGEIA
jgi:hypothetical protein